MRFEFDPAKDKANIEKHGVSLGVAAQLEWDLMLTREDDSRHDYFEVREKGFAPIGDTVYCLVFTERAEGVIRAISLRKATKFEVKQYVNQLS
jgi:uncharacterized protein